MIDHNELAHLLQHVPVSEAAKTAVVARLQEPHRRYHNLDHVLEMWRWHNEYHHSLFMDMAGVQTVASFCLYHDAVYDPQAQPKDNERRSADLWWRDCDDVNPVWHLVAKAISASADHFASTRLFNPADRSCIDWCLNLDLLRLGVSEERFTQHGSDIRAEYAHLTQRQWVKKSAEFRAKVMAQPTIFAFPELDAFERQARSNLGSALIRDWRFLQYI